MRDPGVADKRLNGWKEIAAFFNKTTRAVKRWEHERNLPVHRLPGGIKAPVYAYRDELQAWLDSHRHDATAVPAAEPFPDAPLLRKWSSRPYALALAAVILMIVVAIAFVAIPRRQAPPEKAHALYVKALVDWNERTPESLTRSIEEYQQAIALKPDYAEAFAGLAKSYDIMREYTAMSSAQGFALARTAAEHAIRIDDRLASGHAALAFALFYGYGQAGSADAEFKSALRLDPRDAGTHHWYATYLDARGDFQGALAHINRALELEPSSLSIQADRAMLMADAGQEDEAVALLHLMEKDHAGFASVHSYLAQIAYMRGDDRMYVREARINADMIGNLYEQRVAEAAQAGLTHGGRLGMLNAILEERLVQFQAGNGSPFYIAALYARLGDKGRAVDYLRIAAQRKDENLVYYRSDRDIRTLKGYPPFDQLFVQLDANARK